jgi:GNAT superfamily N-acetyltransferase
LIRPFTPADYPTLARIAGAAFPDYPASAEEKEFGDTRRDPKCRLARWLIERDGRAVGYGEYGQRSSAYHPRRFHINVIIQPDSQGRGLGRALYDQVMSALSLFDPLSVRVQIREDRTRSVRFLHDRGFVEDMQTFESRLDVTAFDPAPFAEALARVRALGIEFKTLRDLEDVPGHWQKHYEMTQELRADVPFPEPYTWLEKSVWLSALLKNPGLLSDACLFAVKEGEYIGVTMLKASGGDLTTGLTGVRREHRRQGIALALKVRAIAWAKENGYLRIKTWNEANNRGMLGINERLGFVRQPAWLDMVKVLKEETT